MAIQNFFTSRDNNLDGNTYVGQLGRLWYNPDTNSIYASDGVTVGGIPVDLATGANASFNNISVNTISSDDSTEVVFLESIRIEGDATITGNISPAANNKIGGIIPGPGANISNTGLLTIDTTGLPLSFGNFTANNNILTIVNSDEDMILATQGSAEIQLVGNVGFYRTNGLPPAPENRYFRATDDGQIQILVPNTDPLLGAVEIIGSASEQSVAPNVAGTMLHVTGQVGDSSSIYNDGVANTAAYVSRRYNGNALAPTQVLSGQGVMVIAAQGHGATGFGARGTGAITFTALEDFTDTAQGMQINFQTAAIGSNTRATVATINSANGVTATRFVTAGTVEATGNITGGNLLTTGVLTATGNISGGNLTLSSGGIVSSTGLISTTGNISAGNISTTGVISATGNITGGNVTATTFTGNVIGNVTGTATTATNLAAATSILAGTITVNPAEVAGSSSSTQTFTLTGLTTSHKIIITSGTAINSGLVITAAWASALNTVSIEFRNTTNQAIDAGNLVIQYFAWV